MAKKRTRPARAAKTTKGAPKFRGATARRSRKRTRPSEQSFPELGDLKDRTLLKHAKTYADEMFQSEEALTRANVAKQAIHSRMVTLESSLFTGHGYEFTRTTGDEKFSARKVKRGSKPADTQPDTPESPEHEFDTNPDGSPIDGGEE